MVAEKCFPDSRGGMELHAHQLAGELIARGVATVSVTRFQLPTTPAEELVGPVEVHRLDPRGRPQDLGWRAVLPNVAALRNFFLWLLRSSQRYDVILVHSTKFLLLPVLAAARLRGRSCVVKVDTLLHLQEAVSAASLGRMRLPGRMLLARWWAQARTALLRRADAVIAMTAGMRTVLLSMGVAPERIRIIPNGIDTGRFSPVSAGERRALRTRLGLPLGRTLVICSGRIAASKGVMDLVSAWQTVAREHPRAHLVFLGSGHHSADGCDLQLREEIRAAGLGDSVTLAGEVDDVHEYLQAADLGVMPSHSEGFCLALVEAMACGLPVVATRVGVAPELIVQGESGTLVEPRRPIELARALGTALERPKRWEEIGARARAAVAERFAMPHIARAYEALFEELRESRAEAGLAARRRITGNAAGLVACRIASDVLSLGLFVAIARMLGPAGTGAYSYGFAVATFVYVLGSLGIDEYGVREFLRMRAADRAGFIGRLLGVQGCALLAVLAGLVGYLWATGAAAPTVAIVAALAAYQLAAAVSRCMFVPAIAHQAMLGPALAELLCRGAAIAIAVVALLSGRAPLTAALAGFALSGIALLAAAAASLRKHAGRVRPHFSRAALVTTFGALGAFALSELMVQAFSRIGLIALSLIHGEAATGLYAAALKFVEVACLPLAFLGAAAYPRLSALAVADREGFLGLGRSFWSVTVLAAGLVPWGLYYLAPPLLAWALGPRFTASQPVLLEMTPLALLLLLEVPLVRLLLAANLQVERLRAIAAGVVAAVLLNLWLVPRMGIAGAVLAFTAAAAFVDALYAITLARRLDVHSVARPLLALGTSLAGAGAIHWLAMHFGWSVPAAAASTLVAFLAIALPLLRARGSHSALPAGKHAGATTGR